MDHLNKKTEGLKIRIKAAGAIRNLINIDDKINNIIGRIKIKVGIDEIRNLAIMLQMDISNAKDDWNDIVDMREINSYKERIIFEKQEREQLLREITESKSQNTGLLEKLNEKDKKIEKIQVEFDNYKNKNNLNMLGSMSIPISTDSFQIGSNICEKCHKSYIDFRGPLITGAEQYLCDECKRRKS